MKLRLLVPHLETNLRRAVVSKWHVETGSKCEYGQPLCDLSVSERVHLRPVRRADALTRFARRGKGVVEERETERDRFVVTYRVLASEPARIVELLVSPGDAVEAGTLLAVAETEVSEDGESGVDSAPLMRVVAVLASGSEVE